MYKKYSFERYVNEFRKKDAAGKGEGRPFAFCFILMADHGTG